MRKWRWIGVLLALSVVAVDSLPAYAGDWIDQDVRDHLTDKRSPGAAVGVIFEERGRKRIGQLFAYCVDNSTTVNMSAEYVYFGSGNVTVRYSLDGGAPIAGVWNACKGGRCIGLWSGQGIPFLKSLFDKREMRAIIDRAYSETLYATINVDGARGGLAEVAEKCGWMPKASAPSPSVQPLEPRDAKGSLYRDGEEIMCRMQSAKPTKLWARACLNAGGTIIGPAT